MKKLLITSIATGVLVFGQNLSAQVASGRMVSVDLNRVFNEYYKTPTASAKLKETAAGYQKELEDMLAKFRTETDDLNKLREEAEKTEYTAEVREQKKKAVQDKLAEVSKMQREIEEFKRTHQVDLERQTQRMRQNILKEITDVVGKEAKDAGYSYVFDKSGNTLNGVPAVVYVQDSLDITDNILKILNKNAPAAEEKPATPATEEKK